MLKDDSKQIIELLEAILKELKEIKDKIPNQYIQLPPSIGYPQNIPYGTTFSFTMP